MQQSKGRKPRKLGRRRGSAGPHKIDILVGTRLRMRRNMLGLSQEKLGEKIGLAFQQLQKYERGANRISASRLHELARVLDVPISFFFEDTDPVRAPAIPEGFLGEEPKADGSNLLHAPETQELVTSFYAVADQLIRRRLVELARALAEPGADTIGRRAKERAGPLKAPSRRALRGRSAPI